jgi:hypothetical protein
MRNNEIVKGMLLQLIGPTPHYSAVAHSAMQYCEIPEFVSLQIHVQGPERSGRRHCQPPVPTAIRGAALLRPEPARPGSAASSSACARRLAPARSLLAPARIG